MNPNDLRNFLQDRKVSADKLDSFIAIAEKFEQWLGDKSPTKDTVLAFSASMIGGGLNTYDNYLAATDEQVKRYHYCHCPWVKESLKTNSVRVSPTFCLCSSGFHKKYWEDVFGQPVKAEVIETVLDGAMQCKFAIHLPEAAQ